MIKSTEKIHPAIRYHVVLMIIVILLSLRNCSIELLLHLKSGGIDT